jgi:hypothetical protein
MTAPRPRDRKGRFIRAKTSLLAPELVARVRGLVIPLEIVQPCCLSLQQRAIISDDWW